MDVDFGLFVYHWISHGCREHTINFRSMIHIHLLGIVLNHKFNVMLVGVGCLWSLVVCFLLCAL
jgi:hypothetical protein